jgi:hypothetical protein
MSDTLLNLACESLIEEHQELFAMEAADDYAAYEQAANSLDRLVDSVTTLTPTTLHGIMAKARVAAILWSGSELQCNAIVLARSLITDLVEMSSGMSNSVRADQPRLPSLLTSVLTAA